MIGFIGLGVMGEPMCRNLAAKSGEPIFGYDVNPAPLTRLRIEAAKSVQEIAERCDTVFLSLPGVEEVRARMRRLFRRGSCIVDLSTTTVALARELHARWAARGVDFADAPVARTRAAAESGTLAVMVGASEKVFTRIRPLLAHIGTDITHCGGPGAGQATKLINNMVLFQNVVALAEAVTLARNAGLSPQRLLETLATGSADSFALRNHGMKALLRDFPERAYSVEYALKDLGYALDLAKETALELRGAQNARAALERAKSAGHGGKYFRSSSRRSVRERARGGVALGRRARGAGRDFRRRPGAPGALSHRRRGLGRARRAGYRGDQPRWQSAAYPRQRTRRGHFVAQRALSQNRWEIATVAMGPVERLLSGARRMGQHPLQLPQPSRRGDARA